MKILRSVVVTIRSRIEGSRVLFCYNSENEPFTKFTLSAHLEQSALDSRDVKYYHQAEKSIIDFGSLLVPRRMKEGPYLLSVDRYTVVGYTKEIPDDDDDSDYSLLSIVFFLQKDFYVPAVIEGFVTASRAIATSLVFEEIKEHFITTQVHTIFAVREKFCRENAKRNTLLSYKDLVTRIISKSALASAIQDLFVDIKSKGVAHIKLNGKYLLPISLNNYENIFSRVLRPYHTLFLFKNPHEWITNLMESDDILFDHFTQTNAKEFISQVQVIIQNADPLHSFEYLSLTTGISLDIVYQIARYLVYWGKARVIEAISLDNVYILAQTKPPVMDAKGSTYVSTTLNYQTVQIRPQLLASKYNDECQWQNLHQLLSYFDNKKSLETIIEDMAEGLYDSFTSSVAWLITHGVLSHVKKFVLNLSPTLLSSLQSESSLNDDKKNLLKILPFCDGKTHLNELIYLSKVDKETIFHLVQQCDDLVMLCHE
ncbi:Nitrogen permease regulator 2 [Entamoeba marina]